MICLVLVAALSGFLVPPSPAAGFPRAGSDVLPLAGCQSNTLARGDAAASGPVALGFPIDFFGNGYRDVVVHTDGVVTFGTGTAGFPGAEGPSIAPFFADVDTSEASSGEVHFGQTTYQGRPAFCVDWFTRNADGSITGVASGTPGRAGAAPQRRNVFQLLLVSTADPSDGETEGDFDIMFNYDAIQWDEGFGGCARAGYSNGIDEQEAFQLAGSGICGAFHDSSPTTGLANTTNSGLLLPDGRWLFGVEDGAPPGGGRISGLATDSAGVALGGAPVTTCMLRNVAGNETKGICWLTETSPNGSFTLSPLSGGTYAVEVDSPAGRELEHAVSGPVLLEGAEHVTVPTLVLEELPGPPPGMTLLKPTPGPGVPSGCAQPGGGRVVLTAIYWNCPTAVEVVACPNGTGTWTLVVTLDFGPDVGTTKTFTGPLIWDPVNNRYRGTIPAMHPNHGPVTLSWDVTCPNGQSEGGSGSAYIDPSGVVIDTNGALIEGATATLYWWDPTAYAFEIVPDGSVIMSPSNRVNPGITLADGRFAWDTLAGDYFVRATAPPCRSPGDPAQPHADTPVVTVPPPALDLVILMWCPVSRFATTISHVMKARAVRASVWSAKALCRGGRAVSLWSSRPGGDRRVSRAVSNKTGRVSIAHGRLAHGLYYLRVGSANHPGDAGSVIKCESARSATFWL